MVKNIFYVSILWNLLSLELWISLWSILVSITCTLRGMCGLQLLDKTFDIFKMSYLSIVLLKFPILCIFCIYWFFPIFCVLFPSGTERCVLYSSNKILDLFVSLLVLPFLRRLEAILLNVKAVFLCLVVWNHKMTIEVATMQCNLNNQWEKLQLFHDI